ncbi:hypothetical protein PILCRDRAFT_405182 [Piloderma croceum F 1598]|uniref:Uncharacterized protein n=1 Tax=Piloderma croceum (strain F 1598) TaxID=765440 RepID=A0A0C3BD65_PILCF|nr:hypothetical protein PILCRDRAFT_405182 [Piloderma croceum F 1598]
MIASMRIPIDRQEQRTRQQTATSIVDCFIVVLMCTRCLAGGHIRMPLTRNPLFSFTPIALPAPNIFNKSFR